MRKECAGVVVVDRREKMKKRDMKREYTGEVVECGDKMETIRKK